MARSIAVFPGSFDPFTHGHREVAEQALNIFDHLIVAIGLNVEKNAMFTPDERMEQIRAVFSGADVTVKTFTGLVVRFAQEENAIALVRGLRTESDFSYEMPMAMMNRQLENRIQTVFLPTNVESQYVSSTLVREIAMHGGDVSAFVPAPVLNRMMEKVSRS